jgi:prephenate dehydratase
MTPPISALAYLGPAGTYGEQASRRLALLADSASARLVPQINIRSVVQALVDSHCDGAVVPVENSVEGGVSTCLDVLWETSHLPGKSLRIERALVLPIRHALLSDGPLDGITEVLSHPQALGQCSAWLQQHLPGALQLTTSSTAEAARMVKGSRFRAAIASLQAGLEHGLPQLAYPINDQAGNCTRFLLLRRGAAPVDSLGNCTSLAFSLRSNAPGALLQALQLFADRQLNMSRIESRPSKRELGEYVFFVDLDTTGPSQNTAALVQDTLAALLPLCEHLACFGSYPVTSDSQD